MLSKLIIPKPEPPRPIAGYPLPDAPQLDWSFVAERMTAATYYWVTSAAADGRPHAAPVWGVWFEDRLYFDGSPATRWARNLRASPTVAVHPPDAEQVVMVEGTARMLEDDELSATEWELLDGVYQTKYTLEQGSPFWVVQPRLVLAWDGPQLGTMTRWRFDQE